MEDLQSLLEKINREGVEKAEAAAQKILAAAKADAASIRADAKADAEKAKADAEKAAQDYANRAAETIKQAARDTVLQVQGALVRLLEKLLLKDVDAALRDEKTVSALVTEAIRGVSGETEVALPAQLAPALKAQLSAQGNLTIVTDENLDSGFSVKTDSGRIESAFTAETVAAELARRLRPDLAQLVK